MQEQLINKLKCPICSGINLVFESNVSNEIEIFSGSIKCLDCGEEFNIDEGVLDLIGLKEIEYDETIGWESFADKEGWNSLNLEYLNSIPFGIAKKIVPGDTLTWDRHARNFFKTLSEVDLSDKDVLDLGAGRCWSSKFIALQNAKVIAADIVKSENVGLKSGKNYFSHSLYFDRVRTDMNHLPFKDNVFDVIWAQGAIHHSTNMAQTIKECYRVLRPDGIMVWTNESCASLKGIEDFEIPEMPGIFEHSYRAHRLYKWLKNSKFKKIEIINDVYYQRKNDWCYSWLNKFEKILPLSIKLKLLIYGGVFNLVTKK